MKFLIVSNFYPPYCFGGNDCASIEMYLRYLAEGLAKKGNTVHILHSIDAFEIKQRQWNQMSPIAVDDSCIRIHHLRSPLRIDAYLAYALGSSVNINRTFRRLLDVVDPDVVHFHTLAMIGYGLLSMVEGSRVSIFTAHDYELVCQKVDLVRGGLVCQERSWMSCYSCAIASLRPPQLWRAHSRFRRACQDIDIVLAPSRYMARELHSRLGRQVTVLPHFAVPPRHIEKSPFSDFFLFSGRLDKRKGIMVLLDAFRKCSKSLHHRLFITGKGPLAGQISAFIKKHGLENRVLLLGYVSRDELWSLYRDATAVVVPSTWPENCPTVVMEAMTVGTPVIGSNCGALPEMISDINGNLLFNTGDSEDLAESLLRLGREAPRSDRITAVQRYSFINYLTRYLELVERSR